MSEIDQGSLEYFAARACDLQWRDFLLSLADELNDQMPRSELRAFFRLVGQRLARRAPLPIGSSLADLESGINEYCAITGWGWTKVQDHSSRLEFVHSCAPLRQAFGDDSLSWSTGLLEGLYAEWIKQSGAGDNLELSQIGEVSGDCDSICFRLAKNGAAS